MNNQRINIISLLLLVWAAATQSPAQPTTGGTTTASAPCEIISSETTVNGNLYTTTFKTRTGAITVRYIGPLEEGKPVDMIVSTTNPSIACKLDFGSTSLAIPAGQSRAALTRVTPTMPQGSVYLPLTLANAAGATVASQNLIVTPPKPKPPFNTASPFGLPCPESEWTRTNYFEDKEAGVSFMLNGDKVEITVPDQTITHVFASGNGRFQSLENIFDHATTNQIFSILQQRMTQADKKENPETWTFQVTGPDPLNPFASDSIALTTYGSFLSDGKLVEVAVYFQYNPCTRRSLWSVTVSIDGISNTYGPSNPQPLYSAESMTSYLQSLLDAIPTHPLANEPKSRWDYWLKVYLNLLPYNKTDSEAFQRAMGTFNRLMQEESKASGPQDQKLFSNWKAAYENKDADAMTKAVVALVQRYRS